MRRALPSKGGDIVSNRITADSLLDEILDSDSSVRQRLEAQRHREKSRPIKFKGGNTVCVQSKQ